MCLQYLYLGLYGVPSASGSHHTGSSGVRFINKHITALHGRVRGDEIGVCC